MLMMLIGRANFILYDYLGNGGGNVHAVAVMNGLIITGFAAVTLAGKPWMFLAWLGADMLGWLGKVYSDRQDARAGVRRAQLFQRRGDHVRDQPCGRADQPSAFILADGLDAERQRNEELVLNMLPPAAVQRIRDGRVVANSYADASVVFVDMVGFSTLAKRISPGHLVELLNSFFNHADACAASCGVEKVKTVGDSYLAIAGGNVEFATTARTRRSCSPAR